MPSEDYYDILGVPRNADESTLKKAYKKLAVKVRNDNDNVSRMEVYSRLRIQLY